MRHGGDIYRNRVRLDFSVNLNPLGTPDEVMRTAALSFERASRYPDIRQEELRRVIAGYENTEPECVYAGNGASELIMAAVRAVRPAKALVFAPSFTGYDHALKAAGSEVIHYALREEAAYLPALKETEDIPDVDMIFICDPVNPTGRLIDVRVLEELISGAEKNNTAVCLDESFMLLSNAAFDESRISALRRMREHKNLYVISSLTKVFAIPGIRMGYVISDAGNIEGIKEQLPEWNLPVTAEAAMIAGMGVLKDGVFIRESCELIERERSFLMHELKSAGLKVLESESSFILCRGPQDLYDQLLKREILIRDCADIPGLGPGFFRIAVKDHESNIQLSKILGEVLNEN